VILAIVDALAHEIPRFALDTLPARRGRQQWDLCGLQGFEHGAPDHGRQRTWTPDDARGPHRGGSETCAPCCSGGSRAAGCATRRRCGHLGGADSLVSPCGGSGADARVGAWVTHSRSSSNRTRARDVADASAAFPGSNDAVRGAAPRRRCPAFLAARMNRTVGPVTSKRHRGSTRGGGRRARLGLNKAASSALDGARGVACLEGCVMHIAVCTTRADLGFGQHQHARVG
jgi:hypothetical protein